MTAGQATVTAEPRRPVWRGIALFFAGLGLGSQGVALGVLVPLAMLRGGFGGYFLIGGLRISGVPGGLDVAGVFFPQVLVLAVLTPLGIASLAAMMAVGRGRGLPLVAVSALWFVLAVATVVLADHGGDFLGTEAFLLACALVATWPGVRTFLRAG